MNIVKERFPYIDFLRFIGMSLVILAHVNTPSILHQIRCFDVPLMVFVSGLSYSGKIIQKDLRHFFIPRFCRLLIPVYIFLTIFFLFLVLLGKPLSVTEIVSSYFLLQQYSIGYVWIIKVFLLIMLATPLLLRFSNRINIKQVLLFTIIVLLLEDILCRIILPNINGFYIKLFISETIPYILGYSIVFVLGVKCRYIEKRDEIINIIMLAALSIVIFMIHFLTGQSLSLQAFKYPPQSYFLIYGMLVSVILWYFRNTKSLSAIIANKFVLFVGRNTIWIYLWHIIFVNIANRYIDSWFCRYFIVYISAVFCFYIQYKIVLLFKDRYNLRFLKYLLG